MKTPISKDGFIPINIVVMDIETAVFEAAELFARVEGTLPVIK